jgi:orotate phosphoribosyltransferase
MRDSAHYRERLKQILCEKSLRRGEFVLSSGKKSSYYLDARITTLDAEGALCTGMAFLETLRKLTPQPKAVGGPTLGADPIVAVVAALSHQQTQTSKLPPISAFIVRKETKQHGTQQLIEGWRGQPGDPVVMVEDTCTTGGSLIKAIDQVRAAGLKVIAAICLVDRGEGGREAIEKHCPFHALFTAQELLQAAEGRDAPLQTAGPLKDTTP